MNHLTKEEFAQERERLHKKIDDKHQTVLNKIETKVTEPINGLIVKIGIMLERYDHQEKTNLRLSKDIESLKESRHTESIRLARVEENQKNTKNLWDKLVIPLVLLIITALSALNYWK